MLRRLFLLLLAALSATPTLAAPERATLTVFAAASLTDALQAVGQDWRRATGVTVKFSFAASSVVARQIEAGAQADLFFSADTQWMDYLVQSGRIDTASRADLLGNRLVLVAPAASTTRLEIARDFPLVEALGRSGRLATGDPDYVPVGRYARSALTSLGVWNAVADRLARTENVRAALLFVARGEAPLGIVYASDALVEKGVRVVDTFPADSHPPIVYPVALVRGARPGAAAFLAYLKGPQAAATFRRFGFLTLP